MSNAANTINVPHHVSRLVSNAQRLSHQTHVLAAAMLLVCRDSKVSSLCCWCAEQEEGEVDVYRTIGGDCDRCSYSGRDCLVILGPAQ